MNRHKARPPRDPHSRGHESAITSIIIDEDRTVLIHKFEDNDFDLGVLDLPLARRYASRGIRRIVLAQDIVVLEPRRVVRYCARRGLDLLHPGA